MNYTNLNQNINIYFKEIRSNDSLTRKDEINLFARISKGDKSAEYEVFNKMAKLAVAVAKTYTNKPDLLEDLIQEANIGMLTAIKKYDPATGYRFSSYARWWMKANISTFLGKMGIVHPANLKITQLANKIRNQFYNENCREISDYELLDKLEEMGEIVTDITSILNIKLTRIDLPVSESEDLTKGEMGEYAEVTASDNEFLTDMDNEELGETVKSLLKKLDPRERALVMMKFGFTKGYEMDYDSITKEWNKTHTGKEGLSQERARQIVVAAIKKMK